MRLAWLGLALVTGCAGGDDVPEQNVGGASGSGGSGAGPMGGAAGSIAWPTGGAGGGGSGGTAGTTGGAGGAGGSPGCSVQGCQDVDASGAGCVQARTIGRVSASSAAGYVKTDTTCSSLDQSTDYGSGCSDLGRDHSYRIFLRAGESIAVTLSQGSKCSNATSWNRVFKIYSGSSCSDTSCGTKTFCSPTGAATYNKSLNVTQEGWYHLVVDGLGAPGADDDSGSYTLTVKLACKSPGCEC